MTETAKSKPKKKQSGQGRRVSIYLPANLAKQIVDKPGINLSRVVRRALTAQFDGMTNVDEYGTALARLRELEFKMSALTDGHAGICRTSAKHAGLVVLSHEEWDQATEHVANTERELRAATVTQSRLEQQVALLQAQLHEATAEASRLRERQAFFSSPKDDIPDLPEMPPLDISVDAAFPRDGTCGKCEYLSLVDGCCSKVGSEFLDKERAPDDPKCEHYSWITVKGTNVDNIRSKDLAEELVLCSNSDCGDVGTDTKCKSCGKPLCWSCYAGDSGVGEPETAMCDHCLSAAQRLQEESAGGTDGPDSESPPSPEQTDSTAAPET